MEEERVVYGTTTGFGALVTKTIGKEDAEKLQRNIILTHSTSVGEPFKEEEVRAIILMVLQSLGMGVSGVRMELLERYRDFRGSLDRRGKSVLPGRTLGQQNSTSQGRHGTLRAQL